MSGTYAVSSSNNTNNVIAEFGNLPFYKTTQTVFIPMDSYDSDVNRDCGFTLKHSLRCSILKSWNIRKKEYQLQIILRLVQVEVRENEFNRLPYNLCVSVNGYPCRLPKINISTEFGIAWRCNVPIDITAHLNLRSTSINTVKFSWSNEPNKYMAGIFVARKVTYDELLEELKKRPLRKSELTKQFIINLKIDDKFNMESDMEFGIDSMFITIKDPITKTRMELPARGVNCIHLECFDAIQFLQMNEKKPTWKCPLCMKKVKFENIEIDEFFLGVVQSPKLTKDCNFIAIFEDGSWSEKNNAAFSNVSKTSNNQPNDVIILSDDSDVEDIQSKAEPSKDIPTKLIEENIIISEHIMETENITETNGTNSTESDRVLDPNLKDGSSVSIID